MVFQNRKQNRIRHAICLRLYNISNLSSAGQTLNDGFQISTYRIKENRNVQKYLPLTDRMAQ